MADGGGGDEKDGVANAAAETSVAVRNRNGDFKKQVKSLRTIPNL